VTADVLEKYISECWTDWTAPERLTAEKALKRVSGEQEVSLATDIPTLREKNVASAIENGKQMTDTLADWIRKDSWQVRLTALRSRNSDPILKWQSFSGQRSDPFLTCPPLWVVPLTTQFYRSG
jgi:hypothetical protein